MSKIRRNALRLAKLSAAVAMAVAPSARAATNLYWDTNGTTAGSGAATGTWGTSNFWNTDPTGGGAGSFTTTTASSNDVFFSAGTNGTTGTVTVSGAVLADSINFQNNVAITISGGTSITLGGDANPGIAVLAGDNAANTISTAVILNSAATSELFSNAGTGLLTVGAITGAATSGTQTITLTSTSTGGITLNGVIGNGTGGGNVGLLINNTGTGATTLPGTNTFTGGVTINGGTLIVTADLNLGAAPASPAVALTINGGTLQENTGFNMAANRQILIGAAGATFNENATANFKSWA